MATVCPRLATSTALSDRGRFDLNLCAIFDEARDHHDRHRREVPADDRAVARTDLLPVRRILRNN